MIIKIKKRSLSLFLIAVLVTISIVVTAQTTERVNFKVELEIIGIAPQINVSNISFTVNPIAGGNAIVLIFFNVTDSDGASDINASTAIVNFTLGGIDAQYYANDSRGDLTGEFGTCGNSSDGSTSVTINCTVTIPYFANQSNLWVVNISVEDISGIKAVNATIIFTYNVVSSLSLPHTFMNFSNATLGTQNVRAFPHLIINNTGNDDFNRINMTAAALVGTTDNTQNIPVTNFGVNLTNSTVDLRLSFPAGGTVNLRNPTNGSNATLVHGHTSAFAPNDVTGNISAFIWVNVPSSGLSRQLYNATWNVTAIA